MIEGSGHLFRDMRADTFINNENYINFNQNTRESKRRAIRQTYTLRGLDSLTDKKQMSIRQA